MPRKKRELPWLDKRKGVFYACWYEAPHQAEGLKHAGRTRAVSLGTSDAAEAAAKFSAFLGQGQTLYASGVETIGLTVAKLLDNYELEHVNVQVTDKTRQINAMSHLRAFFGQTQVKDLDIPASRSYAAARRSGAVGGGKRHSGDRAKGSDSTIRRELNVLVAAIGHAKRWKRLEDKDGRPIANPVVELTPGAPPDEALWLTRDEVKAIHAKATGPVKDFVTLAYYTAARRAAIETLRVDQVTLSTGRLNFRKAGEKVTPKRKVIQAIHPATRGVLERLVQEAKDGWLFGPSVDFYRDYRTAARAAGIDDDRAHPHVLRHSRATHLLQDGRPPYAVAQLLGDTLTTVLRVYGHHCPEYGADALGNDE